MTDLSLVLSALRTLDLPDLPNGLSPFGVGFILWTTPIEILDSVFPGDGVTPHPAAIWLFAGEFENWIPRVREKSPETLIYVPVGGLKVLISQVHLILTNDQRRRNVHRLPEQMFSLLREVTLAAMG